MRKSLSPRSLRTSAFCFGLICLFAQVGQAADALEFWKNYFLTGDYVVGGVGLRGLGDASGFATGYIKIGDTTVPNGSTKVPDGADVIAAYLYWQSDEPSAATKPSAWRGYFDGRIIVGDVVGNASNLACDQTTGARYGRLYRADVLRYLPIDKIKNVRIANGTHEVRLPDSGPGRTGLFTNGATLVLIYRIITPGNSVAAPLKAVVIYDGTAELSKSTGKLEQTIAGFYQADQAASSYTMPTRLTAIVGNGQPDYVENLNVVSPGGPGSFSKPFRGSAGGRWDNPTFNVFLKAHASSYFLHVTAAASVCLTWGAFVTSTPVIDTDRDGLLDVWETKGLHFNNQSTPATFGGCADYPGEPDKCVNLPAMGASPTKPDIFMEIDWLRGGDHVHTPKLAALNMVGDAFANHGIALHFDVGNNYQNSPSPYIIRSGWQGGELKETESDLLCSKLNANIASNTLPTSFLGKLLFEKKLNLTCAFTQPYPVLSFKRGFRMIKDGYPLANIPAHFDNNRKDIFRYALFAHALATTVTDLLGRPLSVSGVADKPGSDIMITLGLWRSDILADDQTGSALVQAGTLMHEIGHNLGLSHASLSRTPNCMPNYPSQMNYLYQVRGLTDAQGNAHIDFSNGLLKPLDEAALSEDPASLGALAYRIRYFDTVRFPGEQPAKAQCDGKAPVSAAIRVEMPSVSALDWNRNGQKDVQQPFLDVNYDGQVPDRSGIQYFVDSNDWSYLNVAQIAARLNANGLSTNVGSLDIGSLDIGSLDIGSLDIGSLDIGSLDIGTINGSLDIGSLDIGSLDIGSLDIGSLDIGSLDIGSLDIGELDFNTFLASIDPTSTTHSLRATTSIDKITLDWGAPADTPIDHYELYRSDPAHPTPRLHASISGASALTYSDATKKLIYEDKVNDFERAGSACPNASTCYNTAYTYYVIAVAVNNNVEFKSSKSTDATSEVTHVFVVADTKTSVYGDQIPSPTYTAYGHVQGTLTGVSCAYATAPRNVATYTIACSGPVTTSDPNTGVTYNAKYNDGTVYDPTVLSKLTITQRPITVTAVYNRKTYDGTTAAAAVPVITTGNLAYADKANFIETYDNRNAGENKKLTPSGTIVDGSISSIDLTFNYTLPSGFVSIFTGVIDPAPVTAGVTAADKVYDGTTAATVTSCSLTGVLSGDIGKVTCSAASASFSDPNVGNGKNVTAIGIALSGLEAGNYKLTSTTATTTANITPKPVTASVTAADKTYDRTATATITSCTLTGVIPSDVGNVTCSAASGSFDNPNAGSGKTVTATGITLSGTQAGNYKLTSETATTTANINPKDATASVTAADKTYDRTTGATITSCTLAGIILGDTVTCAATSASFNDPNVGNGKTVTATGLTLGEAQAGNYKLTSNSATTTANVNQKEVAPSVTAADKTYDRTTGATITSCTLAGVILPDEVTCSAAVASFDTPDAGTNKTVTANGITLSGAQAGNYKLASTTAVTKANINQKDVTASVTATDKQYDGNTSATISSCSLAGQLGGDTVSCLATSASFAHRNVGNGKIVTATVTLSGPQAGNYKLIANTVTTTANITAKPVTPNVTAANKTYDGATAATITSCTLTSVLSGDTVTCSAASASFSDPNVGNGKTVTATGITLGGAQAGNYALTSTTATTTANITPATIVNGGFETGNFNGWTIAPGSNVSVKTSLGPTGTYTPIKPAEGQYMAFLSTMGSVSVPYGTSGSIISQTFTAPADSRLRFCYQYVSNDSGGFENFFLAELITNSGTFIVGSADNAGGSPAGGSNNPPPPYISSGVVLTPSTAPPFASRVNILGGGLWQISSSTMTNRVCSTFNFPAAVQGTQVTLRFISGNDVDTAFESATVVDNVVVEPINVPTVLNLSPVNSLLKDRGSRYPIELRDSGL